jgi:hypothetical protein
MSNVVFLNTMYRPEREEEWVFAKLQEKWYYHRATLNNTTQLLDPYQRNMCFERFHNTLRSKIRIVAKDGEILDLKQ